MNTLRICRWLLLSFLLSLPAVRATAATTNVTLITFDDLVDGDVVPIGYGGLQWSDFSVISDQNPFAIDGYASGVVSPENVVYNPYGEPAMISSSNRFDLVSAYLTAAVIPSMEVEVQGFDGINLPYDDVFNLSTNGPRLITFNYFGVNRVKFIPLPGSQFVMDSLSVRQPSLLTITNSHPIDLGQVEVPSIGHTFTPVVQVTPGLPILPDPITSPLPPGLSPLPLGLSPLQPEYEVTDFLVDQGQESGGGGVTALVSANFDTNNQFTLTITAPPGKQFHVHVPAGQSVNLYGFLDWEASNPFNYTPGEYGRTEISFGNLEGTAPGFYEYSSFLAGGDRAFDFGVIDSMAISNDLSFTSITLLATVPNTNPGPGLLSYAPFSDNSLEFEYGTDQTNDPGPFITLDSTNLPANTNSQPIDLGTVEVPSIGHTFTSYPIIPIGSFPSPWPPEYQVSDFLVDQLQNAGGGGVTVPESVDFDTNNQFTLTITAPPGQRFHVHVPPGQTATMLASMSWQRQPLDTFGSGDYGSNVFSFGDLEGTPPGLFVPDENSYLSESHLTFGFTDIASLTITNDFSFRSFTVLATVPNADADLGLLSYSPSPDNDFEFFYTTAQGSDPGPFVTLDPTNPPVHTNSNPIDLGTVEVPSIGHTFVPPTLTIPGGPIGPGPVPSPWSSESQVNDFLVDQQRESGGGGVTAPVTADFETNNQFMFTIAAPPGERFHVHVPAGQAVVMNAFLAWQRNLAFGLGPTGTIAISFADLEGTPPGSYADSSSLSPGVSFDFDIFDSMAISNDISFSAVTLLATVPNTGVETGPVNYVPNFENAFKFYYLTTLTNDPGPFITLDSTNTAPVVPSTNLITFDDLPDMTFVPNSYGGLRWNNFEVISESDRWAQGGYLVGIISPSNEVFNPYGAPASIGSDTKFDLVSAYLTAAVLPRLQIEVQGFANGALTYDHTYPLTTNSPNFITFNYSGVDSVKFITTPPSQFAMDNLTAVINGTTNVTFQPVDLGDVQVPCIGHVFSTSLPIWPPGSPMPLTSAGSPGAVIIPFPLEEVVKDYLIDQSQISHGGGILPSVTANFDGSDQFVLKISAPAGKRFVVNVPAGQSVTMGGQLDWQGPNVLSNGPSEFGTTAISFEGLEGAAPDFVGQSAVLSLLHGFFGFNVIQSMTFSNDISFDSVTLTATVPSTDVGSGALNYTPLSGDALSFYYFTTQTNDPGPFVSLVAPTPVAISLGLAVAPASLSIKAASDGSSVITFTGTLQSAASPNGPFVDISSNPQGTYRIPKDSMGAQQFFRAR